MQSTTEKTVFVAAAATHRLQVTQQILRFTYGLVPIVAGLDKFTNLLTHWVNYLNPSLTRMLPLSAEAFMRVVGVIEIVAGLLVLIKPKWGALLVATWLVAIALDLVASGHYFDVAVRDLVMAIGAYTLYRLSDIISPE